MAVSTAQFTKLAIVSATGLAQDALHVHTGIAVLFIAALVSRRSIGSVIPLSIVLLLALLGEVVDMRDDLRGIHYWRWRESLHDVWNTMLWPVLLYLLARHTRVFDRRGRVDPDERR